MDDFIERTPDDNFDWQGTRKRLTERLVTIGKLYGDPEAVMTAKANVVTQALKLIVQEVPDTKRSFCVPAALSSQKQQWLLTALTLAAAEGAHVTLQHVIVVLSSVLDDLCTSKLAHFASDDEPGSNSNSSPSDQG